MKKALILGIACFFTQSLFAQKTIKFSVKYLPMQNYATTFKMDMDVNMNIDDTVRAQKIKASGQPSSMLIKMNMATVLNIATQAQDAKKDVPFTMTYNDVVVSGSMNGQALPIPVPDLKSLAFKGHYSNQTKKIGIEGLQGGTLDDAKKAAAEGQLLQIFNQYSFPDTTLKIGDTFEQTLPLSIPTAAGNSDVITQVKFTLKEVKGNEAIFDMSQTADAKVNIPQANGEMVFKGTGGGTMVYDISAKFPVRSSINMNFSYKMNVGGASMSGDMKGVSVTEVKVTKK